MHTYAQARASHERSPAGLGSHAQLAAGLGWFSLVLGTAELAAPRAVARLLGIPDDPRLVNIMRAFGAREIASGLGLLTQPEHAEWAWSRVGGDAIDLAFLGSAANEDSANHSRVALAAAAVVGVAALDLICARRLQEQRAQRRAAGGYIEDEVSVERAITVARPVEEVFAFWKGYANLPRFMKHLTSVETLGENRTRWTATGPAGVAVSWDAETTVERENEWIAWRSLENADVCHHGSVRFREAPGQRGTEVHVHLQYRPPAGRLGRGIAWLFGEEPGQQIKEDLRRLKQLLETGEISLAAGIGDAPARTVNRAQVDGGHA